MNITDKSKEYAEGKALSAITSAIEDAYAAGYQEGYEDGYANREKPETPSKYNNVSYINWFINAFITFIICFGLFLVYSL